MFKGFRDALRLHNELWNYAGYWADVVAEYGKLTGFDIGKIAKRAGDEKVLDEFCRAAKTQGLTPRECALVLYAEGYHDQSVLLQNNDLQEHDVADETEDLEPEAEEDDEGTGDDSDEDDDEFPVQTAAKTAQKFATWQHNAVAAAKMSLDEFE